MEAIIGTIFIKGNKKISRLTDRSINGSLGEEFIIKEIKNNFQYFIRKVFELR